MPSHYIYDIETYPNYFSLGAIHDETGQRYYFEISDRIDHSAELLSFLEHIRGDGSLMVGFNNIGFDYPVIHYGMTGRMDCGLLKQKANSIINTDWGDRFAHIVWPSDVLIPQIELFKIHHFDNKARRTSLKAIEFAMRMESIQDLPYDPTKPLSYSQMDDVAAYMWHDVEATQMFYSHSKDAIEFRRKLSEKYGRDCTNDNDTKIGKQYFIRRLEEAGVRCFHRVNNRRTPRQTPRPDGIRVSEILQPFISFNHPEFQRVHEWFKNHTITNTREELATDPISPKSVEQLMTEGVDWNEAKRLTKPQPLTATVNGLQFVFGLGGIHGSVSSRLIEADLYTAIIDVDVTSYYPSVPISHRIYPEHLGEVFCDIYADVKNERMQYAKGTPENAVMKLALNGAYGETNNVHSPCLLYTSDAADDLA